MLIQQATKQDLTILTNLFDQYRQFYRQDSDKVAARQYLTERMERKESIVFLAKEGEEGAGFTQLYPFFSSVSMRRMWVLNDLFVHPDHRKKGVATALINQVKVLVKETGAKGIMLETEANNHNAKKLYKSLGFILDENEIYYWIK